MAQCGCGGNCSSDGDVVSTKGKVRGKIGAEPEDRLELGLRASRRRKRNIVAEEQEYAKVRQKTHSKNKPTY